jgi:hypothetical protein
MAQQAPARTKILINPQLARSGAAQSSAGGRRADPLAQCQRLSASWAHRACAGPQAVGDRIDIGWIFRHLDRKSA